MVPTPEITVPKVDIAATMIEREAYMSPTIATTPISIVAQCVTVVARAPIVVLFT